ncbi:uncharacterized protein LOC108672067 [Hyalella azteca]|uniref:Uncharacterized protein LOC108672067 n=1 Tax=Hyalella azteca TaxID=294128 RepID=A0A8B7NNA5_HYAAZ|nr:uncharacterized protein LOC108672067 [Hyalella azteca]
MKILTVFLIYILSATATTLGDAGKGKAGDFRYLTGYTGTDWSGASYEFTDYAPDLSVVLMNNAINSSCSTGLWIAYDNVNFNPNLTGGICSIIAVDDCKKWAGPCQKMASSLRYAGSEFGLNDNFYNLYEGNSFHGAEFKGNINAAYLDNLDLAVSSLIITGQSGWTFYTGVDFTDASVCVYADEMVSNGGVVLNYARVYSMDELGLPDNSIRSVSRGCASDRIVGTPPQAGVERLPAAASPAN